jgi:riboflavin biosynthesis pyrimidine reductase
MDQAFPVRVPPTRVRLVGVHFKPWGISPFADMPATGLRDRWVPADAVWGRSLDQIRNQADDTASATEALRVLEEELRSRLAGERTVMVNAGEVGSQVLAAGLVDEVAMDVVPVVFGSGKRYFGSIDGQQLLEDPHVVIQGDRVLHLRFKVRR